MSGWLFSLLYMCFDATYAIGYTNKHVRGTLHANWTLLMQFMFFFREWLSISEKTDTHTFYLSKPMRWALFIASDQFYSSIWPLYVVRLLCDALLMILSGILLFARTIVKIFHTFARSCYHVSVLLNANIGRNLLIVSMTWQKFITCYYWGAAQVSRKLKLCFFSCGRRKRWHKFVVKKSEIDSETTHREVNKRS